jgi:hypothetical protein
MEGYEIMVIALITSIVLVAGSHFISGNKVIEIPKNRLN